MSPAPEGQPTIDTPPVPYVPPDPTVPPATMPAQPAPAGLNPKDEPQESPPPEKTQTQQTEAAAPDRRWSVRDEQKVAVDKMGMDLHFFSKNGMPHLRIEKRGDQHGAFHGVFSLDGAFIGEDVDN